MKMIALVAGMSLLVNTLPAQTAPAGKLDNASNGGVRVALLPPSPKTHEPLRYELSEPAYVAAFVVFPGSGVRLLYPLVNAPEQLQSAGYHTNQLIGSSFDDDFYNAVLGPRLDGASYLYVIASRHPLDVARYVHRPMRLASAVGEQNARSFYADVAFDGIVNNAISLGDAQSWDADVYTLWTTNVNDRRAAQRNEPHLRLVMCANGTTQSLPDNYPFAGCPGDRKVVPVVRPTKPVQATASAQAPVVSGGAAKLMVGANSPTVLPTIIGKRISDADRRAAIAREGAAAGPVMYTAANGSDDVSADHAAASAAAAKVEYSAGVAPGVQLEITHGSRVARRERFEQERRARQRGEVGQVVGGNPQLPPNPKLAPNPRLAPAPISTSAPARETERGQSEMQQRQVREVLRTAPSSAPPAQAAPQPKPEPVHH